MAGLGFGVQGCSRPLGCKLSFGLIQCLGLYRGVYRGYIDVLEKKMETAI